MSSQLMLPGLPVTRVKIRKPRSDSPIEKIVRRYAELRGPFVQQKQRVIARRHAKQILEAGFTAEQAIACMNAIADDEWWSDKSWTLAAVLRKLPQFVDDDAEIEIEAIQDIVVPEGWKR